MRLLPLVTVYVILTRLEAQETSCNQLYELRPNTTASSNQVTWLEADDYAGYLEICAPTEPSQWTPVCGEYWTNTEALAACNILGYSNTTTIAIAGGQCLATPGNITTASVEILQCSGTEKHLDDCSQSSTVPKCSQWGGVICTSLNVCAEEICSNSSYCHFSPSCSNCTIPQELNCFCYSECHPPCMNGGSCVYNNTCQCPPYWTGQHCEQNLPLMTDINTLTDNTLPVRNISTCPETCLNGGSCSDGICLCTENYGGNQCGNKNGSTFPVLYVVISILISLLIFSVFIGIIAIVVIFQKAHTKKMRTHKRTSNNQTVPPPKDKHMSDLIYNTAYQNSTLNHKCDEDDKCETNLMIHDNIITTGNYYLVGPVEDDLPAEHINMSPKYAEIQDVPDWNMSGTTMTPMPTNVQNPDDTLQEYSELSNAYKEEQKSVMKGHQQQLGNYSKLDHGMLLQPRSQHQGETYSTLDMSNSESEYRGTKHNPIQSDSIMNDSVKNTPEDTVCKEMLEMIYTETKNVFPSSADGTDEGSHPIEMSDKGIINYEHSTLHYNPQYNCN